MDIEIYSKKVLDYIDSLSDEEFDEMLLRAGIENCPFEDDAIIEPWVSSKKSEYTSVYMQENKLYNVDKYTSTKYKGITLGLVA